MEPRRPTVTEHAIHTGRRDFLKTLGGGLLVILSADPEARAQESGGPRRSGGGDDDRVPHNVSAWLRITPDGGITAYTGKTEVGQNIRTSLTQAIADELRCAPSAVQVVMADTALTPWDMGTFGSLTTLRMAPQLRKMAGAAREELTGAAAKKWGVDRASLKVAHACVTHPATGRKSSFGEIARELDWTKVVGSDDAITPPDQWTVAGRDLEKINAREIVTGKHKYTSDLQPAGTLCGQVLRAPSLSAQLVALETKRAEALPGVKVVRDRDFVGVAAPSRHLAQKAIEALQPAWTGKDKRISAADIFSYLKANPDEQEGVRDADVNGALEDGKKAADKIVQSTYTIAYIAHVPLEPRSAVAEWNENGLTVWTGSQRPFGVRGELATALGVPEERVRVIVPDTGSAYGGKHTGECAIEAARLAKAAGKPVKLVWSREEEFTWAYFRPAGVIEVNGAAKKDGTLTAWEFHNYNSGPAAIQSPYEVANRRVQFHPTKYPLRQGSYRGLAATANHFARESHIDEMAGALGLDPLEFRLRNLKEGRVRNALIAATERFGWTNRTPSAGHGFGLSCGTDKGSYFGCCVDLSVEKDRSVRIHKVVQAFECGAVVNPTHLRNQVEGSIMMGIGGALFEAIDFADGRILNPRLSKYRVPRFSDTPEIEVVLMDRKDLQPYGAGETPIMGIAPAIANAIYQACGIRVRSMPILPGLRNA
jgi:isoquinoline 1-oxidoreductase